VARAGVDAMEAGRRTSVPGLVNKAAALGYRFTPRTTFLPVARLAQSRKVRRLLLGDEPPAVH
jgi:short-subunit dehydrogenase